LAKSPEKLDARHPLLMIGTSPPLWTQSMIAVSWGTPTPATIAWCRSTPGLDTDLQRHPHPHHQNAPWRRPVQRLPRNDLDRA